MTKKILISLVAACFAAPAFAGDAAAGAQKAKTVCAACHGPDGNTSTAPDFPRLAGQHEDYLLQAMKQYKSGARKNPIMQAQVQPLSTKEMEDLAAYFAQQKGSLYLIRESRMK